MRAKCVCRDLDALPDMRPKCFRRDLYKVKTCGHMTTRSPIDESVGFVQKHAPATGDGFASPTAAAGF